MTPRAAIPCLLLLTACSVVPAPSEQASRAVGATAGVAPDDAQRPAPPEPPPDAAVHPILRPPFEGDFPVRSLEPSRATVWALPPGTSVLAAADGTVVQAGPTRDAIDCDVLGREVLGQQRVVVEHSLAEGTLRTRYAHLARVDVGPGDAVRAGQQLGLSGASGCTLEPALRFAVIDRTDGARAIDPYGPTWLWEEAPSRPLEHRVAGNEHGGDDAPVVVAAVRPLAPEQVELRIDPRFAGTDRLDLSGWRLEPGAPLPRGSVVSVGEPLVVALPDGTLPDEAGRVALIDPDGRRVHVHRWGEEPGCPEPSAGLRCVDGVSPRSAPVSGPGGRIALWVRDGVRILEVRDGRLSPGPVVPAEGPGPLRWQGDTLWVDGMPARPIRGFPARGEDATRAGLEASELLQAATADWTLLRDDLGLVLDRGDRLERLGDVVGGVSVSPGARRIAWQRPAGAGVQLVVRDLPDGETEVVAEPFCCGTSGVGFTEDERLRWAERLDDGGWALFVEGVGRITDEAAHGWWDVRDGVAAWVDRDAGLHLTPLDAPEAEAVHRLPVRPHVAALGPITTDASGRPAVASVAVVGVLRNDTDDRLRLWITEVPLAP